MTFRIQFPLAFVPLGLALAGCGGPDRRVVSNPRTMNTDQRDSRAVAVLQRQSEEPDRPAIESRYDVTLDEIRGHQANHTAVLIDAREPVAFNHGHLRGATNIPSSQKENYTGRIRQDVATSQLIIIYCNGPQCAAGDTVYDYLTTQGFTNMRVFKPGWEGLASAKYLQ